MKWKKIRVAVALAAAVACLVGSIVVAGRRPVGAAPPTEGAASVDGKALFARHCANCHGEQGDGKGPAAVFLYPKPRDLTSGKFKVRTTGSGEMPTEASCSPSETPMR